MIRRKHRALALVACVVLLSSVQPIGAVAGWVAPSASGTSAVATLSAGARDASESTVRPGMTDDTVETPALVIPAVPASRIPSRGGTVAKTDKNDPVVTEVVPSAAMAGTTVEIRGSSFGPDAISAVTIAGNPIATTSWTDTLITFVVADDTLSGDLIVETARGPSNAIAFTRLYPPHVTSIAFPDPGDVVSAGDTFILTGTSFMDTPGSGWVTWAGLRCQVTSWSDTSIEAIVPTGARAGLIGVVQNGVYSNGLWQHIAPYVSAISRKYAVVGGSVTVTGENFGPSQGSSLVKFAGAPVAASTWSDTEVTFVVPPQAGSGYVGITRDGVGSNGQYLMVAPRLTGLSTSIAPVGSELTITGVGFGSTPHATSRVTIGGAEVPVVSWSDTSVTVLVSENAKVGYVGVWHEWSCSNGLPFVPGNRPHINSVDATSVAPGDVITITGTDFPVYGAGARATVGGVNCEIISWTTTQVVARVPEGATTGYVGVWILGIASNGIRIEVVP